MNCEEIEDGLLTEAKLGQPARIKGKGRKETRTYG
jgi:hypothetical protein